MNDNRYRAPAERGDMQLGTWVTMIRTFRAHPPAGPRAGYAAVVNEYSRKER